MGMKVLKKLKRRMGLVSRSGSDRSHSLPPLQFHAVHGDNIAISPDGCTAHRVDSFCKGVAFSHRPVKVSEKVYLRVAEMSTSWSGVLRVGFTSTNPASLAGALPKYACPDLTNKPGYWAKALAERYMERDVIICFHVCASGDVHLSINGDDKGIFFGGVDVRSPLWVLVDVYGNTTSVQFVSPVVPSTPVSNLNNQIHRHSNNNRNPRPVSSIIDTRQRHVEPESADHVLVPSLSAMNLRTTNNNNHNAAHLSHYSNNEANYSLPPMPMSPATMPRINPSIVATPPQSPFGPPPTPNPLQKARTRGKNIRVSPDHRIAWRHPSEFAQGYVFSARPLRPNEQIVLQIVQTEDLYVGGLTFGLTSCDPASLQPQDLPDDSDLLLDRPEYWVNSKDVARGPRAGEELAFGVSSNGEVFMCRNGEAPVVIMHVDHTLNFWPFFDLYGNTQSVRLLGTFMPAPRAPAPGQTTPSVAPSPMAAQGAARLAHVAASGGLVVSLPREAPVPQFQVQNTPPPMSTPQTYAVQQPSLYNAPQYVTPPTATPFSSRSYIESISLPNPNGNEELPATECTICYERGVDSVLYSCGHMCMCYDCAVQLWRGRGGGQCPMCRAMIKDFIKMDL
nr:EOG090X03H5 [Triops cancriformis]